MKNDSQQHGGASLPASHGSAFVCAQEIASEYTHTKYVSGIAEIIAKHFPELPDGKQMVSENAIAWLYANHPEAYHGFYALVDATTNERGEMAAKLDAIRNADRVLEKIAALSPNRPS